jgi:hypothetical protein
MGVSFLFVVLFSPDGAEYDCKETGARQGDWIWRLGPAIRLGDLDWQSGFAGAFRP